MVVGWYHSHPGFGCWLSSVDVNTQQVSLKSLFSWSLLSKKKDNRLTVNDACKQSFEQLNPRAVAVVIDPIQSVKGKVVIDAFRTINPQTLVGPLFLFLLKLYSAEQIFEKQMMGQEPRQTTSNIGHLNKPSIQALIHGLNRHYYSQSSLPPHIDLKTKTNALGYLIK